ncbi:cytochrome C [Thiohalomonas denitrificans]|uniref:Dihaem cytochrome c n=1 Tax=Thiohalomonas denitrificans TaxID=415747 RepID=A0A1G5PRS5_9GAMM|nr:cytochrome C [Thiohalomonas denitrificans]SCZ52152.1 Dihaem cytochrome c [Thiohalomonas denitrificans]
MNWKRAALWACVASLTMTAAAMAEKEQLPNGTRELPGVQKAADFVPPASPDYRDACGTCHFAYPAGLLPPQSWERILTGLNDHFGEKVELSRRELSNARRYLLNNAAGRGPHPLPYELLRSLGEEVTPLRITMIPYFVEKHAGLPREAVRGNPQVRFLSHCDACHTRADEGRFSEDEVEIPDFTDR